MSARNGASSDDGSDTRRKDAKDGRYEKLVRENREWHQKVERPLKEAEKIARRRSASSS